MKIYYLIFIFLLYFLNIKYIMDYYSKYLHYKNKYLELKARQFGGTQPSDPVVNVEGVNMPLSKLRAMVVLAKAQYKTALKESRDNLSAVPGVEKLRMEYKRLKTILDRYSRNNVARGATLSAARSAVVGAVTGAASGALVGGPVGALLGAARGAAVGAAKGAAGSVVGSTAGGVSRSLAARNAARKAVIAKQASAKIEGTVVNSNSNESVPVDILSKKTT